MMDTAMIRDSDKSALQQGLSDALQMLKGTPLFEEGVEDYLEVLDAVEKLDIQLKKDSDVLGKMCEMLPSRMDSRMEDLVRQYEEMCAETNVTGSWSAEIARLRSCRPQSQEVTQNEQNEDEGEDDVGVVEVVKSHRDPLGGGLIKDPIKNKHCGHVYDRTTMREYIKSSRARRAMFYQCPYSLCENRKNMDMLDMIDYPEFFAT